MNVRRFFISALLLAAVVLSGMFVAQSASAAVRYTPGMPKPVRTITVVHHSVHGAWRWTPNTHKTFRK